MKRFFKPMAVSLVALVGAFGTGCGSLEADRIDSICDCEDCGERDRSEVEIIVQTDYDIAATYDCIEVLEPLWECQLDRHECDDGEYRDDNEECEKEAREYYECLDAKSTREPGPYND